MVMDWASSPVADQIRICTISSFAVSEIGPIHTNSGTSVPVVAEAVVFEGLLCATVVSVLKTVRPCRLGRQHLLFSARTR